MNRTDQRGAQGEPSPTGAALFEMFGRAAPGERLAFCKLLGATGEDKVSNLTRLTDGAYHIVSAADRDADVGVGLKIAVHTMEAMKLQGNLLSSEREKRSEDLELLSEAVPLAMTAVRMKRKPAQKTIDMAKFIDKAREKGLTPDEAAKQLAKRKAWKGTDPSSIVRAYWRHKGRKD